MTDKMEIYEDKAGEWRWRLKAPNGDIIADSGEGYKTEQGAEKAAKRLFAHPPIETTEAIGTDDTNPPIYRQNIVRES